MISVLIVNYHTAELTRRAVYSVLAESEECEIIIVDNTADIEETKLLQKLPNHPKIRILFNDSNEGFARACNRAYAESDGEWIFLLNPDSYVLPGALSVLREFLVKNPAAGAVGPRIYWDDRKTFLLPPSILPSAVGELCGQLGRVSRIFGALLSNRYRWRTLRTWQAGTPFRQEALSGGHVMIRRAAVEKCGGLFEDHYFMYYEDSDLMLRLRKAGYALFVVPHAEVVHNYIHSAGKMELMRESKTYYFNKHFGKSVLVKMADGLSRRKPALSRRRFMNAGRTRFPVRIEIPGALGKRWLFEWSPSPIFIPSVGSFGTGPVVEFPQEAWDLLGPGKYYARISSPQRIAFLSILWTWEKE